MIDEKEEFKFYTKMEKRESVDQNKKIAYAESVEEWITFWRENPHRFIQDYFQIRLKDFQEILITSFSKSSNSVLIATRGIGKSFLTAVYACAMAVLYPNSKIVIVCGVKAQAKTFISEKIEKELYNMSLMLRKEIDDFKTESETKTVLFKNGSTITATNAHENRRGFRATILIVDEAVMVDQLTLEKVCIPFLNTIRNKGYTDIPKYANYQESFGNQTLYLTSAWYKAHYFYNKYYVKMIKRMLNGNSTTKVFNFSYETPLRTHLLPQARVDEMMETLDPITFQMEVESIFYGENENSFFKADEINNCRILEDVYYPPNELDYLSEQIGGTYKYHKKKKDDEIRVLSADIALTAGKQNDNSVYILNSLYHEKKSYRIEVSHIESHNGMNPDDQALRIKRLFYEGECDRVIIDAYGVGMAVYNELLKETYDPLKNVTYPAWRAYNVEGTIAGIVMDGVEYVMYAMKATQESNHIMAVQLKSDLISGKIHFPVEETTARNFLNMKYNYSGLPADEQARLILPFREMHLLFAEMIDLEYMIKDRKVYLKEKGSARKDRYSSLAYNVFLCHDIINSLNTKDITDTFVFFT